MIVDLSHDIFTQKSMFLGVVKPWGFCDFALWLRGQIGSGWCQKDHLGKSIPMHQRMLDFVERIKSYDHLKLLI
jgi:hypothetical protein